MELKSRNTKSADMFSLRMESDQRKLIDEAAAISGVSSGRFIRDAAISRAAEVLNASGEREVQLRELAKKVVGHLFHARAVGKGNDKKPCVESELWKPQVIKVGGGQEGSDPDELRSEWRSLIVKGAEKALRAAFENAGKEFIRLILEEWDGWGKQGLEYKPCYDVKRMLSKGDGIGTENNIVEEEKQNGQ